jgi:nucleolar protein 56
MEVSNTSMGQEMSEFDTVKHLINQKCLHELCEKALKLYEFRKEIQEYLKDKMEAVAPNLTSLIGENVGAKLISHSGSLVNLAKYPASTIQILGAEKALFRALKTKTNTPKYGLLYHSSFIGRANGKNKGKISRFVANKCSIAARLDHFLINVII